MDLIVVMKDGEISELGSYTELIERDGAFSEFIQTYLTENFHQSSGNDPEVLAVSLLSVAIVIGSVSASRLLHADMLNRIVRCPMSFFDTTPLGRILNRFSKDVDIMDNNIQQYVLNLFLLLGPLISTFIIIMYTTPMLIAVFVPLAVVFSFLQRDIERRLVDQSLQSTTNVYRSR
ncbi:hypothetical protein LSH36_1431g00002 [Paralvinella palmiformis]|uniref:ABC transmembrane type-1 domain-containing protein n=1 Tax=Paralvinella palmiformis TaxID=53620 RepID=A0AAD9ITC5_9ANNE|nr:hypothetical protein LSH36_1431g00002 [Paralvinella palmiformis]